MIRILLTSLCLFSTTLIAQSWERLANAPIGRHHPITFSLDGKGYAVTGSLSNNQLTDDFYEYNPVTNTWATMANFPGTARSFGIGTVANGKAYIGFGVSNSQYLGDLWSYDPTDSTWTQLANCNCARRHPAMISIGDRIYVGLGNDANSDLKDWWMYSITTDTWTQIADLPGPARHHPFMFNTGGEVFAGLGHSGASVYKDWYKLDTALNTWSVMNQFPGESRVAGTQFSAKGYGYVLSGDGDNHSFMNTGEMWQYDPIMDSWIELPAHPGQSRWAPGSFVIDGEVYFFGGLNRATGQFPTDLWKYDALATIGLEERKQALANTYVYPNPANGILTWKNDKSITDIKVYNSLGQVVETSSARTQQVNTVNFDDGIYFVQFFANSELVKTSKVLIQH